MLYYRLVRPNAPNYTHPLIAAALPAARRFRSEQRGVAESFDW